MSCCSLARCQSGEVAIGRWKKEAEPGSRKELRELQDKFVPTPIPIHFHDNNINLITTISTPPISPPTHIANHGCPTSTNVDRLAQD